MIPRYTPRIMQELWSEENKFRLWLEVELAVMEAYESLGMIPSGSAELARKHAIVDVKEISKVEEEVGHDVIAFIKVATSSMGDEARFFHYGLTSSDVIDTALSLTLKRVTEEMLKELDLLLEITLELARKHKYTSIIGRTHGVHAESTSFGLKALNWYAELKRIKERLSREKEAISLGKVSGAVGNYANVPPEVEEIACEKLGLKPCPISTQIIPRDIHAEYLSTLAVSGGGIERIATEIRNLMRTEIDEVEEPFSEKQRGSSAMPHKKNPILCERLCGIARLLRGYALSALEDVALWHERDISHSSVERVIFPDATSIFFYSLKLLAKVLRDLKVNKKRMEENIWLTKGLVFSERALLELINRGLSREEAYLLVQEASMEVKDGTARDLKSALEKRLPDTDLSSVFSLSYYFAHVDEIFRRFE
ncbi:MAG: adenylosuccinate lyase [Coprothermobacterota bacterium]|nr:adenylosuccinate lyase [Coprothermobacterota bacterium]